MNSGWILRRFLMTGVTFRVNARQDLFEGFAQVWLISGSPNKVHPRFSCNFPPHITSFAGRQPLPFE